jgi:sterol desaturase/sphingolipid hydroxylase (fatty acid hydroxylase superfamily)
MEPKEYKRVDKDGPYAPHYHGPEVPDPVHRNTIARMFRSDFLEFFSRVHPVVPAVIYGPLAVGCVSSALQQQPVLLAALGVATGGLLWTFTEYMLHRYVFHLPPKGPVSSFIYFQSHGIHHQYPDDYYRLLMVPPVSLPLAGLFYLGFRALLPPTVLPAVFGGFIVGYLAYDYVHFAVHHLKPPRAAWAAPIARWFKAARRRHLVHHFGDHHRGYGVSTGLWDHVFRTVAEK